MKTIISKFMCLLICSLFLVCFVVAQASSPTPADRGMASEEFRRGVQSYYRGSYNDAILQFEKALSYIPDEPLIIDWLAKSYYKSGMESTALDQWEYVSEIEPNKILLQNKMQYLFKIFL